MNYSYRANIADNLTNFINNLYIFFKLYLRYILECSKLTKHLTKMMVEQYTLAGDKWL